VASSHAFGSWHTGTLATAANQLAAMPSLHIAWAAWSALALWRILAGRRWAWLVWAYPAVTSVAVMATGNHYLLDVVAGAATMVVATVIADWFYARRSARVDQLEPVAETVVDVAAADTWTLVSPAEGHAGGVEPGQ
jgi:membrane-associated phospholipid phosphatase